MEGTLFNIFAGLTVLSALLVVANPFSRNPVTSALFLVTTMISISGLFVLLGAYFLAAVQILVYAGAVMVLFLFVIMLLDLREAARRKLNLVSLAMGIMAVGALFSVYKSSLESTYGEAPQQHEVAANNWPSGGQGGRQHTRAWPSAVQRRQRIHPAVRDRLHPAAGGDGRRDFIEQKGAALMEPTLSQYLLVSGALFAIGLLGVIVRRNLLIIYMSLELMLNAANVALVAMSRFNGNLDGQVMVFFIITVAAAEVSVGLALIVALYRKRQTADVEDLATMKL